MDLNKPKDMISDEDALASEHDVSSEELVESSITESEKDGFGLVGILVLLASLAVIGSGIFVYLSAGKN